MTEYVDTKDLESLSGAVYFSVGRGTEGGSASYRLSVAGVSSSQWGQVSEVAANSGYSMGAIQVDFGQRGTWPLGAIEGRDLQPGETTYVDAVIEQASAYAERNQLPFTEDLTRLRTDLLTHGNGQRGRSSITFIDSDTRDSINAWASSPEGKSWIHSNIDYPQVRNATQLAVSILDQHGSNVSEDRRFEAVSILAKTANQAPAQLEKLKDVLSAGGGYDDLLDKAREIKANPRHSYYDGPKAAEVAERYAAAYADPVRREALDRAQAKVSRMDFNPSTEAFDADIQTALGAIGQPLRMRQIDQVVLGFQSNLNDLGITDARGRALVLDGDRGSRTNEAVAEFQRRFGLEGRELSNAELQVATQAAVDATFSRNQAQAVHEALGAVNLPPNLGRFAPDPALMADGAPAIAPRFGGGAARHPYAPQEGDHERRRAIDGDRPQGNDIQVAPPVAPELANPQQTLAPRDPRDPSHPDHAMNQSVREQIKALYAEQGANPTEQQLDQLTAGVMRDAKRAGMDRVASIEFSEDPRTGQPNLNGNLVAYSGDQDDLARTRWSYTSTQQAQQTPPERAYQEMDQAVQQRTQQLLQFEERLRQISERAQEAQAMQR